MGEALLEQLVCVGGAMAGVLITNPAMPGIWPTLDVAVIRRVIARADSLQLGSQLRQRGLQEDSQPGVRRLLLRRAWGLRTDGRGSAPSLR